MGLIRDPAPFYTNSNITGRRATEDDVQKLREVLAANAKDFPKMDETSARYLNEGLARASSLTVVPLFVATFVTCNAFGGAVFFDEFAALSPSQRAAYPLGLALLVAGVLILAARKPPSVRLRAQ